VIYSGGPLAADIPDIDLASFTLARAKEPGGEPALIDGPSSRAEDTDGSGHVTRPVGDPPIGGLFLPG
jgi:hypothetical protein